MSTIARAELAHGTKPTGHATGTERWVTIQTVDAQTVVRAHAGWSVTDEATFTGPTATAMAETYAEVLWDMLP